MSEGYNKVILFGNLGADPELRHGQTGTSVLNMRLAINTSHAGKDGKRTERTDWVSCVTFGKRAEALANILSKGSTIMVDGRLQTRSYDKDGQKRYVTEVVCNDVVLTGSKPGGRGAPREEQPAQEPPADDAAQGGGYGGDDDLPFVFIGAPPDDANDIPRKWL